MLFFLYNLLVKNMKYINKILLVFLITLIMLIVLKSNENLKPFFYKYVYEDNISFADLNNLYKKYFGNQLPFVNETKEVFNESIKYNNLKEYSEGIELEVDMNYLVPALKEGMVVFVGEKENYGKTIIVSGVDGIDIWYSNVDGNVSLYDYIEKGEILGSSIDTKVYLVFKKGDEILKYDQFI